VLADAFFATVSASLLFLAFSRSELAWLAWVALAPLLFAIRRASPRRAFALAFAAGTIFFWSLLSWALVLRGFNVLNFALANLVNAGWIGLFGIAASILYRRFPRWSVVTLPSAWVLVEYAKLHASWLAFPWGILGASQYEVLAVIQLASLAGVYGVSFLIVMVNAALVARSPAAIAGGAIVVAAALAFGSVRVADFSEEPGGRIAAIQANTYWGGRRDMRHRLTVLQSYRDLTMRAAERRPSLIAWPSDSVPALLPRDKLFGALLSRIARESRTYLLVGSSGQEKFEALPGHVREPANSAFLFSPEGKEIGRYDKIRLLPFDEYLPLRGWVPWPEAVAHSRPTDFRPGSELHVFETADARFGVLICWENLFPDLFRTMAGRDVDYVVSMTNESFTDSPVAHRQMLAMNALRAVENHVAIVRTSTTGISAFIDPLGRIRATVHDPSGIEVGVAGNLETLVPFGRERTPYTRAGDWLIAAAAVFLCTLRFSPTIAAALARGDRAPTGAVAASESS